MIVPQFAFDADANGYMSETFEVESRVTVDITLTRQAPVVILKREEDGEFANYGTVPEKSDHYNLNIDVKSPETLKLATPVAVKECYIL